MAGCITSDVLHSGMVQPKDAPLSFRPPPVMLGWIDAFAAEHGVSRHMAVLRLIERGHNAPAPAPGTIILRPAVPIKPGDAVTGVIRGRIVKDRKHLRIVQPKPIQPLTALGEAIPKRFGNPKPGKKS
jgi:hypothetical protein